VCHYPCCTQDIKDKEIPAMRFPEIGEGGAGVMLNDSSSSPNAAPEGTAGPARRIGIVAVGQRETLRKDGKIESLSHLIDPRDIRLVSYGGEGSREIVLRITKKVTCAMSGKGERQMGKWPGTGKLCALGRDQKCANREKANSSELKKRRPVAPKVGCDRHGRINEL